MLLKLIQRQNSPKTQKKDSNKTEKDNRGDQEVLADCSARHPGCECVTCPSKTDDD